MSCVNREQLRKDLLLYAVTDRSWLGNETLYEQVEKALKGGVTLVQLREKELSEADFEQEAKELLELCHKYNVNLIINDNVHWRQKSGRTACTSVSRTWGWKRQEPSLERKRPSV